MNKIRTFTMFLLLVAAAAIHLSVRTASAAAAPGQGAEILLNTYVRNTAKLQKNNFGIPLFLESYEKDERVHVDVYGIFDQSFKGIVNVLKDPANWCDIVSLHPNVKACTYRDQPGAGLLTFYIGKKVYQPPKDTRQVIYNYRIVKQQQNFLDIILSADAGPFGTENHRMRLEAMPLDGKRTFVHVSYEYSESDALRFAEKAYFATLGRSKVGFTETGTDEDNKPVYIGGPRGAIERNAVRYYFAIQTFMHTMRYPEQKRFSMRLGKWYDLTMRYRRQLHDLDKNDYLAFKATEHKNQLTLQRLIAPAVK